MEHTSEQLKEALQIFGFSDVESVVYRSLVRRPSITVLELSRITKVPRSTLYGVLETLEEKGYLYKQHKHRSQVYVPVPPERLRTEFEKRSAVFHDALNLIEYSYGSEITRPTTSLLEGADGFRKLWRRIFDSGVHEYYMITSGVTFLDFIKEEKLIHDIIAERVKRHIKSKQLIPESELAKKIRLRDAEELRESRFLPKGTAIPTTIILFGKEIAFMTTRRENTVILLMSGETALTFQMIFSLLWDSAKK